VEGLGICKRIRQAARSKGNSAWHLRRSDGTIPGARAPGIVPWNRALESCPQVVPSSRALKSCPQVVPSSRALKSCPGVAPGVVPWSRALGSCPGVVPRSRALESCPGVVPWSRARKPLAERTSHSYCLVTKTPMYQPDDYRARLRGTTPVGDSRGRFRCATPAVIAGHD